MNENLVRISMKQVQLGMISAEDIYNTSGLLLIPKKTPITQNHLFRMKLYQIFSILVYAPAKAAESIEEDPLNEQFKKEHLNFKVFSQEYEKAYDVIKNFIEGIGLGYEINIDELYCCCNSLINKLESEIDLFNFLHHLENIDDYTYSHCLNVSLICNIFGKWLQYNEKSLQELTIAGLLHDIGKTKINVDILYKPGKLTTEEFEIVKEHAILGYNILKPTNLSYEIKMAVLQHHEKFDGSGYPFGFKNPQIVDYAKIVTIADIYDAMTSDRSYHKRISPFKVIGMFENEAYQLLDTSFLSIFLEKIALNYIGNTVLLSNQETGKIVFINKKSPSCPLVQVGSKMYNLEFDKSIEIVKIIS